MLISLSSPACSPKTLNLSKPNNLPCNSSISSFTFSVSSKRLLNSPDKKSGFSYPNAIAKLRAYSLASIYPAFICISISL